MDQRKVTDYAVEYSGKRVQGGDSSWPDDHTTLPTPEPSPRGRLFVVHLSSHFKMYQIFILS